MNQLAYAIGSVLGSLAIPAVFVMLFLGAFFWPAAMFIAVWNLWKVRRELSRLNNTLESGVVHLRS
jgi:hypothetical protein